ncbi:MAG: hypothetical protein MZW92_30450 [Comamonadaceae bacterium]|nr:hypothetical protein [Comamonadaceae bacterium]
MITLRQGPHQRRRADGRGDRASSDLTTPSCTGPEHLIEFFHGYTYSAHPLACAAGAGHAGHLRRGRPARRARSELAGYFADAVHSLKGVPQRHRHPQHRPGRRHRARAACRASRPSAPSTSSSTASSRACWCAPPATSSRCRRR